MTLVVTPAGGIFGSHGKPARKILISLKKKSVVIVDPGRIP